MTKHSPPARPGPKARGEWAIEARGLRRALAGKRVAHGEKEQALLDAMAQAGVGGPAQSARRRLAALDFLEQFSQKHRLSAQAMEKCPLASIELLSRWSSYDESAASLAAKMVVGGQFTVEMLREKEQSARRKTHSPRSGRALDNAAKAEVLPFLKRQLPEFAEVDEIRQNAVDPWKVRAKDGVDFLFVRGSEAVAVVMFGPFRDERLYRLRQAEFVQRILGLSLYHDQVWVVLPRGQGTIGFEGMLERIRGQMKRRFDGVVRIIYRDIDVAHSITDPRLSRADTGPRGPDKRG